MARLHSPLLISSLLCAALPLHAQDTSTPAEPSQSTQLAPVVVHGQADTGYSVKQSQLSGFGPGSLHDTPASVSVLSRELIDNRQPRSLSELAYSDAALGDNYAPVGYYQDVSIRGFPLDLATGFRFNDLTITAEQPLALENIQQVEVLKGEAGLSAGVVAPGGLINYVSKRPADVQNVTVSTDSHGSRYTALDVGRWLTPTFGVRVNTAYEDTHSYVQHTDGRRNFYAIAADWLITSKATLELDADYKASAQRSASGYQLLGGTTLPSNPSRTRLLGFEPWQQPVSVHAANATARFKYQFNDDWQGRIALGHSRSVIDDNVAFAYGCFYQAQCADSRQTGAYFAPNGDYDIYDYRSPDDTRQNDELRAQLDGHFDTGPISHSIDVGVDAFRRRIDQRPYVYDYVGTANIADPEPPYFAPSPNQPGAPALRLSSWQRSAFALDRMQWGQWQLLAGGRFVRLNETDYDDSGIADRHTTLSKFLPQTALLWQPTAKLTGYVSYSEGLALGNQAPYWATNADVFLPPLLSRQIETGVKYAVSDALNLGAAIYRIHLPYQYAKPDDSAAGFTFVQQGEEVHSGLELNATGQLSDNLQLVASASFIQARAQDTGTSAYQGHQVVNVPKLRTSVYADYRLPFAPAWSVMGGWRYAAPSVASPDGLVRVSAYNLFDAGLRYRTQWREHALTWRLSVDNVFNHFYWRDTGTSGGDSYLFPGAPRLARLSLTYAL
ncbi:MAG: TonB-dependent siderophore receptor [Dyella sp.]